MQFYHKMFQRIDFLNFSFIKKCTVAGAFFQSALSETDLVFKIITQLGDTDTLLLHGVAVADGDSVVIE